MRFVIVTGMSGAGKSTALKMLEDMGYFCVDNLPIPLLTGFARMLEVPESSMEKVALGLDVRGGQDFSGLEEKLNELDEKNVEYEILFLDASDDVLVKRYKETRRQHPLSGSGRVDTGIAKEREKIAFLKMRATYILDTSKMLTRELRLELEKIFVEGHSFCNLFITVMSFGFKYGIPQDADLVFDVRFLPNPYYIDTLREKTGNDPEVQDYVMENDKGRIFLEKLKDMMEFLIPNYILEGKNQLVVAIGCTGGKHRSVTLANALYKILEKEESYGVRIEHRDIGKDSITKKNERAGFGPRCKGGKMSFSGQVREELAKHISPARHCCIAELAAFIGMCGTVVINRFDQCSIKIHTENFLVARKVFTLIEKTFNIKTDIAVRRNTARKSVSYAVVVRRHGDAVRVLQAVKMLDEYHGNAEELHAVNPLVVQQTCCRRAFLRGAFQASGSMSDPRKSYHFEIVCSSEEMAEQIRGLMSGFSLDAKIVPRKKSYIVYLKEGSQIVDMLNVMEAHVALMELENVRILKEMRNSVNRQVNCETANINKTVSAAVKQVEDITYLRDRIGFENMPENLVEAAIARLENPNATLKELGESLTPPVGKSGINHRLRKLSELADKVRREQGGIL